MKYSFKNLFSPPSHVIFLTVSCIIIHPPLNFSRFCHVIDPNLVPKSGNSGAEEIHSKALYKFGLCGRVAQRKPFFPLVHKSIYGRNLSRHNHPEHIIPKESHGHSIMLLGGFSSASAGKVVRVDINMDGAKYRAVLKENLLQSEGQ